MAALQRRLECNAASSASDNSSSCVVCHNLSELKVSYIEDDSYNNNYSLSSHYARNRTDLRTWNANQSVNCSYCHQDNTTVFAAAMTDADYNSSIQNHSTLSSSPFVFQFSCHNNTGGIHNNTLTKLCSHCQTAVTVLIHAWHKRKCHIK